MFHATEIVDLIPKKDQDLQHVISELMWRATENRRVMEGREHARFECHSICRALALEIGPSVKCIDGEYLGIEFPSAGMAKLRGAAHSWLVTESRTIIDPYPIGMIVWSPLLLVSSGTFRDYASARYRPNFDVTEHVGGRDLWRKARVLQKLFKKPSPSKPSA